MPSWWAANRCDRAASPQAGYLQRQSLAFDSRIFWLTFVKVLRRDGVAR